MDCPIDVLCLDRLAAVPTQVGPAPPRGSAGPEGDHSGITDSPAGPGRTRQEADPATTPPSSRRTLPALAGRPRTLLSRAVNRMGSQFESVAPEPASALGWR
jgi:hypothetical protein